MQIDRKLFLQTMLAGAGFTAAAGTGACRRKSKSSSAPASAPSPNKAEKLLDKVFADCLSTLGVAALFLGDSLGLFKAMAEIGPTDARRLAAATALDQRYALEWLRAVATAGYVEYNPATQLFELPVDYQAVFTNEDSPMFAAGLFQGVVADLWMIPKVAAVFRNGGGIPYGKYPAETFESIDRG